MYQTLISQNKDPALMKVKVGDRQALKTSKHILLKCWLVIRCYGPLHQTLSHLLTTSTHARLSSVCSSFFFSFPFYTLFSMLKIFFLILLSTISSEYLISLPYHQFSNLYTFYSIHNIYQNL